MAMQAVNPATGVIIKKYDEMAIDASVMIGKESSNSRGYALRAIARREEAIRQGDRGLFSQAIRDHDNAIELSRDNHNKQPLKQ